MLVGGFTSGGKAPKFHAQVVAAPPVDWSEKFTIKGEHPALTVAPILATGACALTARVVNRPIKSKKGSFLIKGLTILIYVSFDLFSKGTAQMSSKWLKNKILVLGIKGTRSGTYNVVFDLLKQITCNHF